MIGYVYCTYDFNCIENTYGEDGEYTGFNHDEKINHEVSILLEKNNNSNFYDSFEIKDLNDAYLVYVLYSDGGTFGRTDGNFEPIGIYSYEEATKIQSLIFESDRLTNCKKELDNISKQLKKYNIYACWNEYFSKLQDCRLKKIVPSKLDIKGRVI